MKIKNAAQPRCRIQIQQNKETKWIIKQQEENVEDDEYI